MDLEPWIFLLAQLRICIICVFLTIQGNFYFLALKVPTTIYLSRHLITNNLYFKVVNQFCLFWTLLLLFSKVHRDRVGGQGRMVSARNISFGKTFSHEDSQTLEQPIQRDCEISTPGDIQSMTGEGFEQSHLRYSCFKWMVNPMTYGNLFQKKSLVYDSYPTYSLLRSLREHWCLPPMNQLCRSLLLVGFLASTKSPF